MKHYLKTVQPFFDDVFIGSKKFEVRKNDRNYEVGHFIVLKEYDSKTNTFTENTITAIITYILNDELYCKDGYVVIGFEVLRTSICGVVANVM